MREILESIFEICSAVNWMFNLIRMNLVQGFSIGNVLSTVMEKFSLRSRTSESLKPNEGIRSALNLRFHSAHGKAITLCSGFSVAKRDERYFEHSVVFSHRPIEINETVAVEILEISTDFHGPLRIGLTSHDPSNFQNYIVPLGRDLKNTQGFWIKSVQLFPMTVGAVIYFKVDPNGTLLYGVDGENGGVFLKNVDISQRLWVMLEAYGSVQSFRFVDKSMTLANGNQSFSAADESAPLRQHLSPVGAGGTMRMGPSLRRVLHPVNSPLLSRRNVRLAPLQNVTNAAGDASLSIASPNTPAFQSPCFSPGLCIICSDREKNTAFTKCGHLCMCYACAEHFQNQLTPVGRTTRNGRRRNLCPICRQPITSILRIYV